MKKAGWWTLTLLAMPIALYGIGYLVFRDRLFPPQLAESFRARPWGIYPHAFFGAIALAFGPLQFHRGILVRRRGLHRLMGKIYLVAALLSGAAGVYMAIYAFGGAVTKLGFGALGAALLFTTSRAFLAIRGGDIEAHRAWMIRSYALLFSAVTLRLELPILINLFEGFTPAYRVVAWSCWVPNLLVAETKLAFERHAHLRPAAGL